MFSMFYLAQSKQQSIVLIEIMQLKVTRSSINIININGFDFSYSNSNQYIANFCFPNSYGQPYIQPYIKLHWCSFPSVQAWRASSGSRITKAERLIG